LFRIHLFPLRRKEDIGLLVAYCIDRCAGKWEDHPDLVCEEEVLSVDPGWIGWNQRASRTPVE